MKILLYLILLLISLPIAFSQESEFNTVAENAEYVIRLFNGDQITGTILEFNEDSLKGNSIKFKTLIGTTIIYFKEIKEIQLKDDLNRHSHRIFIMPTAEPIKNNAFLGNYMLAFFYAGFGIFDIVSVTAGRSVIPTVPSQDQISLLNLKATVFTTQWEEMKGGLSIAIGLNHGFVNHNNRFTHLYTNFTFIGDRTDITGMFYVKTGESEFYDFKFADYRWLQIS